MSESVYHAHLRAFLVAHADDPLVQQALTGNAREVTICAALDLEPARLYLESLSCPVKRRPPRDPVNLLRLLLLMLLCRCASITTWVKRLRSSRLLAALTGFAPDAIPGIGTIYAFLDRLVNGPYQPPCAHVHRPAEDDKHRTIRHLHDQTDDRHAYPDLYDSQSEALAAELTAHVDEPRLLTLQTRLEDLVVTLGLLPSLEAGLFGELERLAPADAGSLLALTDADADTPLADADPEPSTADADRPVSPTVPPTMPVRPLLLDVSGDGSPLESAGSPHGQAVCGCSPDDRQAGRCHHPRSYTTRTAQWCYCTQRRSRYLFGNRYYHLTTHVRGHDLPLLTWMGTGSEADHTLSLRAMDDLLKLIRDHHLPVRVATFAGDMHHDTAAHADWYADHDLDPVIPLCARTARSQPETGSDSRMTADGAPVCPCGAPMRHHAYDRRTRTHVYACPAKRFTERQGQACYVFHPEDCPNGADCRPDSPMGPFEYRKTATDRRLYPAIPRDSQRFQRLYAQRTSTERLNALHDRYRLDRRARSAAYGAIYLTLAVICEHAVVRYLERLAAANSATALLRQVLAVIRRGSRPADAPDIGT